MVEGPAAVGRVTRWGGFDLVRATAMLLGIAYHATFAYVPDIARWYVVQDVSVHPAFAVIGSVLHAGRMQAFFAVAGFFGHLIAERSSTLALFAADRWRRLAWPLLVAAPLVVAFDVGSQHFATSPEYRGVADSAVRPLHLWFLVYALLFSFACWPLRGRRIGPGLARWPELVLLLAPLTAGAQLVLGEPTPAFSYWPQLASLAHFGPFFLFGWLTWASGRLEPPHSPGHPDHVEGHRAALHAFRRGWWGLPVGLAVACWVYSRPVQWQPLGIGLGAFASWAMVLGAFSVAARIAGASSARLQWLVDSSYWVYLSHYPVVVLLHVALAHLEAPAALKYGTVVLGTSLVTLSSYAWVIRRSPIGAWLTPRLRAASKQG